MVKNTIELTNPAALSLEVLRSLISARINWTRQIESPSIRKLNDNRFK